MTDTLSNQDLKALLVLNRLGARRRVLALLEDGVLPSEILERMGSEDLFNKAEGVAASRSKFDPDREIAECGERGVCLLTWFDAGYPPILKEIPDAPLLLYMMGGLAQEDAAAIAIVGSRHPSFYGLEQARRFSGGLARSGLTVISGFAQGIDRAAHEGALGISYGRTVAVLGCGIDIRYPSGHEELFEKIRERGALITEYALGTTPRAENFPSRNRIIAGLSLGALVVEAHERSGSLITAHQALEQGREVFAVPGPVDRLTSRGTHRLIKEGAHLVESPQDVLDILVPSLKPLCPARPSGEEGEPSSEGTEQTGTSGEEQKIISLLRQGMLSRDEMVEQAGVPSETLIAVLTRLELRKKIAKRYDGRFVLAD